MLAYSGLWSTPGIIIYIPSGPGRWVNTENHSDCQPLCISVSLYDCMSRWNRKDTTSHLSATFRAVWRKRAWSFSFRLCSACVMRALERSRHWRQLAICCANFRNFITCKRRSRGERVNPDARFLLRLLFCAYLLKLRTWDCLALGQRCVSHFNSREQQQHENKHRDSMGILDRMLWMLIKKSGCQRNPVKVCEINYVPETENRGN